MTTASMRSGRWRRRNDRCAGNGALRLQGSERRRQQTGLFFGNPAQLGIQAIAVLATIAYAVTMTVILLKILKAVMGLRVSDDEENSSALDHTRRKESAYTTLQTEENDHENGYCNNSAPQARCRAEGIGRPGDLSEGGPSATF